MPKKKKTEAFSVRHSVPDLIDPGQYLWQVTRVEVNRKFMNTRKAFVWGDILPPSPHCGVDLYMACSLPQKPGIRSKFFESWIIANWGERPARNDRLGTRIFVGKIFKVEVRTVAKNEKGESRNAALHYSVVDRLIERVA